MKSVTSDWAYDDRNKLNKIRSLLETELNKLHRRQDEDDELFDSEYTSLAGNGVNCAEAVLAVEPIVENVIAIIEDKEILNQCDYE